MQQKQIRLAKRAARKAIPAELKQQKSALICQQIINHPRYQAAKHVSAYLAMPEEVSVQAVIENAWAAGKTLYLPVVMGWGKALKFAVYHKDSELVPDSLGIKIPKVDPATYLIQANSILWSRRWSLLIALATALAWAVAFMIALLLLPNNQAIRF